MGEGAEVDGKSAFRWKITTLYLLVAMSNCINLSASKLAIAAYLKAKQDK
jgi:hypothetical protein